MTHSENPQVLMFQEDEDPVLEGIQQYPIILLFAFALDDKDFIGDFWLHRNGSWDFLETNQDIKTPSETELSDLSGNILRVSILPYFPLVMLDTPDLKGYFIDVLEILADLMNFQISYQSPSDGLWGSKNKDGTWSGMVGELLNNQSDISIGGLSITQERSEVIDFTQGLIHDDVTLNYQNMEPTEFEFDAFFQVFQSDTWISIGVAFIILTVGLYLGSQIGPNKFGIMRSYEKVWVNYILRDPDGHNHLASSSSVLAFKMCLIVTSLFSLLVMTIYTGDLTSKMTASGKVDDLTSFQGKFLSNYSCSSFLNLLLICYWCFEFSYSIKRKHWAAINSAIYVFQGF